MIFRRFKITEIGHNSQMSESEYEECVRSINRKNAVKKVLNSMLDVIDKPDNLEESDDLDR